MLRWVACKGGGGEGEKLNEKGSAHGPFPELTVEILRMKLESRMNGMLGSRTS